MKNNKTEGFRRKPQDVFLSVITYGASIIAISVLVFLVGYIVVKGVPNLKLSMFSLTYTSENVSVVPAIITDRKSTRLNSSH